MANRLPLTVGFARVSQATEDQGNLEMQSQDYGVQVLARKTPIAGKRNKLPMPSQE